ncbi:MAG TPA: hypothetical protein VFD38_05130 [Myxococcaceae bacterium]|nr:hypothetical protein [Myxococcaceae bacterium]
MRTPLLVAVLLPLTALAHPWTPAPERLAPAPSPVYELRGPAAIRVPAPGSTARTDDVRDVWSVDATLAQLDRAVATRNFGLMRWVDGRARGLLDEERLETWREIERARLAGDGWRLRSASWKLSTVARLEDGYRAVAWRLDPWSVARRRAILVDLDRLNRHELALR